MQITWFKSFIRYNSYDSDDTYATSSVNQNRKFNITLVYDTLPGWFDYCFCCFFSYNAKSEFPFHIDQSVWVMLLIYFTRCFGHNHCTTLGNANNDDSFQAQILIRECKIYLTEMIHLRLIVGELNGVCAVCLIWDIFFDVWCFVYPIHNVAKISKIEIKSKRIFIKRTKLIILFPLFSASCEKKYIYLLKFVHMKVNFLRCSCVICRRHTKHSCIYFYHTVHWIHVATNRESEKKVQFENLSTRIKCKIMLWNHLLSRSIQLNSICFLICKMKCNGINHNLLFYISLSIWTLDTPNYLHFIWDVLLKLAPELDNEISWPLAVGSFVGYCNAAKFAFSDEE